MGLLDGFWASAGSAASSTTSSTASSNSIIDPGLYRSQILDEMNRGTDGRRLNQAMEDFSICTLKHALSEYFELPKTISMSVVKDYDRLGNFLTIYVKDDKESSESLETAMVFKLGFKPNLDLIAASYDYTPKQACIELGMFADEAELADLALKLKAASS